jgi:alkanesulfonate monooxygenase SsuD/methylene tetrahydromethanopterin reductase-like flavin-dependent oxidoreductase (luciferase family)
VLVGLSGGAGRQTLNREQSAIAPLSGSPETMAAALRQFADAGISHVQLVMDPITVEAIEEFAPVLEILDRA